jgi:hypothetical protein
MASITRAEFDALRRAGAPIPKVDYLVEANGKRVELILTEGVSAVPTNPDVQDQNVRNAIVFLADLTEFHNAGRAARGSSELSDLIESGNAFRLEHAAELYALVDTRLKGLEQWRPCADGKKMDKRTQELVNQTLNVLPFLRAKGF